MTCQGAVPWGITLILAALTLLQSLSPSVAFAVHKKPAHALLKSRFNNINGLYLSSKEDYNVERYQNRAALTEILLKEKVQEVKLLKGKVSILQDVVKKLQLSQKNSSDTLSSTNTEWKEQLQNQEQQRDTLMKQVEILQKELAKTKNDMETQAQEQSTLVQQLKSNLVKLRRDHQQQLSQQQQELSQLNQNKMKALQQEVLDLDQLLETTQSELKKINRQLAHRDDNIRNIQRDDERKQELFQRTLNDMLILKEAAIENMTMAEAQRAESIEIASAAVHAAEKRELAVRKELDELKAKYEVLLNEKKGDTADVTPILNDGELKRQVEDLKYSLQKERLLNESNRKAHKERFEVKLQTERDKITRLQHQSFNRTVETSGKNDRALRIWNRLLTPFRRQSS